MLLGAASMSGNKGKSLALAESSSTNSSAEEGYRNKEIVQAEQVKLLDKRLRILEDETELLKVAFYEGVEERRKLVHAIQNEFQAVNHFRCLEEHTFGYTKRQRHGLPQILGEDSNPAVVFRELRASEAVFQDATVCVPNAWKYFLCFFGGSEI
uniref:Uncharacterized protein isoform X1 n=2 Tax=Nicotiana TaxID=4085 RepID=A0A1S3YBA2_TOBAC|nr:PREDICTED: uncharacterized protein LOC104239821 isoform X3 [Nicotiana sylvestris]XP_016449277.1 PREDICTED: uncharacterized protein LOC107774296 isoform X1 [Nicotiana tabacum]